MCFTLQRYKFSSKSQLPCAFILPNFGCVLPCKGTNFQANHNSSRKRRLNYKDVFYLAKVQIFKQITTASTARRKTTSMCFTLQRYKFSSKSQPKNHTSRRGTDVFYLAKVQIFKQITTMTAFLFISSPMCFTLQRYNFYANHNERI